MLTDITNSSNMVIDVSIGASSDIPNFDVDSLQNISYGIEYIIPEVKYLAPINKDLFLQKRVWNFDASYLNRKYIQQIACKVGISDIQIGKLEEALGRTKDLLAAKGLMTEIMPSVFIDHEDINWVCLRLTIPIDKERYSLKLEDEIIETMLERLDDSLSKSIIINVKPY